MASPTTRASNVWQVEAADDILQISTPKGPIIAGIDSTGAGFGALASGGGGGTPAGSLGDIQVNNNGVFGNAASINSAAFCFLDPSSGGGFFANTDSTGSHALAAGQNSIQVQGSVSANRILINAREPNANIEGIADNSVAFTALNGGITFEAFTTVSISSDTAGMTFSAASNIAFSSSGSTSFDTTNGDPGTSNISFTSGSDVSIAAMQSSTGTFSFRAHHINTSLQVFANNAAAIAGGLIAGDLYRTGADPDPVCIVH